MNKTIEELRKQIAEEETKIKNCDHIFDNPFYNPYEVTEAYGSKLVTHGSDHWYEPEDYRKVKKDRWTRICKKCGFNQHTEKQKPVIKEYTPDFE